MEPEPETNADRDRVVDEAVPLLGVVVVGGGGGAENLSGSDYMKDWEGHPWHRIPSVFWLLPVFSAFSIAFGGVAVPRLNIILSLICRQYFSERNSTPTGAPISVLPAIGGGGGGDDMCQIPEIHARTSTFVLVLGLVTGLLGAVTSPRLGSLSDRYGRRKVMAVSSLGLLAGEISTIAAVKYPEYLDVNVMLVGAVLDGLCGSFLLAMALANSYGADCTTPHHRAMAFGALQGCLFLGIAVGPALGGILVEWTGSILSVFYAALGAHTASILYTLLVLPESLSRRRMLEARATYAAEAAAASSGAGKHWSNPLHLFAPLSILFPTFAGTSARLRLNLLLLAAIECTLFGMGIGAMTVIIMYAERQFHWHNFESAMYLSVVNSARVTMLFVVLPLLITWYRRDHGAAQHRGSDALDIFLIRFAIVVEALGYLSYAVAPSGTVFTAAGVLVSLGGVGSPTIQSSLTKHIPNDRTGQLLGALALLHSLARVVTPTVFNLVYAKTVGTVPQTVFICLAATFTGAAACSLFVRTGVYWEEETAAAGQQQTEEDGAEEERVVAR